MIIVHLKGYLIFSYTVIHSNKHKKLTPYYALKVPI